MFALQGLGPLYMEMNQTIITQAIGQGVSSTFLPEWEQFLEISKSLGINEDVAYLFWNDPQYGLNNDANFMVWIEAAYK